MLELYMCVEWESQKVRSIHDNLLTITCINGADNAGVILLLPSSVLLLLLILWFVPLAV